MNPSSIVSALLFIVVLSGCEQRAPDASQLPVDRTSASAVPGNRPSAESPALRAEQAASESVSSAQTTGSAIIQNDRAEALPSGAAASAASAAR